MVNADGPCNSLVSVYMAVDVRSAGVWYFCVCHHQHCGYSERCDFGVLGSLIHLNGQSQHCTMTPFSSCLDTGPESAH